MVHESRWFDGPFSPAEALNRIINDIEYAFATGDYDKTKKMLKSNLLQSWFGLNPSRFLHILNTLDSESGPLTGSLLLIRSFIVNPQETGSDVANIPLDMIKDLGNASAFIGSAMALSDRIKGHPVQALEKTYHFEKSLNMSQVRPVFDADNGYSLFNSVQRGITEILAGQLRAALTSFKQAQLHVPVPSLSFLHRDAFLSSAMIEAAFGHAEQAAILLEKSRLVPRTTSWAELSLDASESLLEILLETENTEASIKKLDSIHLQDIGEKWPFYILALSHIFMVRQEDQELSKRLSLLASVNFPKNDGEGLSGSVINMTLASIASRRGDFAEAFRLTEKADTSIPSTAVYLAVIYSKAGAPEKAIEISYPLIKEIEGLRKLELLRFSALAHSYLSLNRESEALQILSIIIETYRDLQANELMLFVPNVRRFAAERLEEWPETLPVIENGTASPVYSGRITESELAILRLLAAGKTEREVSHELFISDQSLSDSLSSLSSKMDASSIAEAVIQAESRGLI